MSTTASRVTDRSLISREFLRHHERLLRPDLSAWASQLHRELDKLNAKHVTKPDQFSGVSSCMNKASFVVSAAGYLERALDLCQYQLAWVAQRHKACSDVEILRHAIQPWVNIGRLCIIQGSQEKALPHFTLAENISSLKPVAAGPCFLSSDFWSTIQHDTSSQIRDALWNVYALETVKSYLRGDDFSGLKSAVSRLRHIVPDQSRGFITEGEVLGLLHQGDAEQAVIRAVNADATSAYDESAFKLHQTTGLVMLGRIGEAMSGATPLIAFLTCVKPERPKDAPTILRQLRHLSLLMEVLDETRYALALALRGLDICADYADQPLQFKFLNTVLRLSPEHPEAPKWAREKEYLSEHSLYAEVRSEHTADPKLLEISPFFDLIHAVEAAASGTN
jgi:hypothetical protein